MVENVTRIKSVRTINVDVSLKTKKHYGCERDYIWIHATCSCENGKYVGSIIDNPVIMCDEAIKISKTVSTEITPTKSLQQMLMKESNL